MRNLEEVKAFFMNDRFAVEATGIEILEAEENYAKCRLNIEDRHMNAAGQVMGGAIFTLADFTFAVATNTPECHIATINSQINYLGTLKGTSLIAQSEIIKIGRTLCTLQINITDNLGNKIAVVVSSGMRV